MKFIPPILDEQAQPTNVDRTKTEMFMKFRPGTKEETVVTSLSNEKLYKTQAEEHNDNVESQNNERNLEKSQHTRIMPAAESFQAEKLASTKNEDRERIRMELQPLNLKKNYEPYHENNLNLKIDKNLKDRTPGQDLLEWCKEVTAEVISITLNRWVNKGKRFHCVFNQIF